MYNNSNKNERVSVYIDFRNIEGSLKDAFPHDSGLSIDYKKLIKTIVGDRTLVNACIFDGFFKKEPYENEFLYRYLSSQGFIVYLIEVDLKSKAQKGLDVLIACTMLQHAYENQYDTAVILSGDKDFLPAMKVIRGMGKRVEGSGFDCSTSNDLRINSTRWHRIDDMSEVFELNFVTEDDFPCDDKDDYVDDASVFMEESA